MRAGWRIHHLACTLLHAPILALALLFMLAPPIRAAEVDLLLVLAVDASGSVNAEHFGLQRQGYAAAFRNPRLLRAIQGGDTGAIAVTMTQWTGPTLQVWALPWTRIANTASAERFAAAIEAMPRQLFGGGISLSGAITHAASLFLQAPFSAARRVIDISGDGANNRGPPASEARDAAVADGIVINGLPILGLEPNLAAHYRDHVIGGPGAFLVPAENYDSFSAAILRKLISEIAAGPKTEPDATFPRFGRGRLHSRVFGSMGQPAGSTR